MDGWLELSQVSETFDFRIEGKKKVFGDLAENRNIFNGIYIHYLKYLYIYILMWMRTFQFLDIFQNGVSKLDVSAIFSSITLYC